MTIRNTYNLGWQCLSKTTENPVTFSCEANTAFTVRTEREERVQAPGPPPRRRNKQNGWRWKTPSGSSFTYFVNLNHSRFAWHCRVPSHCLFNCNSLQAIRNEFDCVSKFNHENIQIKIYKYKYTRMFFYVDRSAVRKTTSTPGIHSLFTSVISFLLYSFISCCVSLLPSLIILFFTSFFLNFFSSFSTPRFFRLFI
jgi:hypothetical protein